MSEFWKANLGRALVGAAVLVVGASLAMAQVRSTIKPPADPELPAAAPTDPADPSARPAPKAKTAPADPRTPARRPAATAEEPAAPPRGAPTKPAGDGPPRDAGAAAPRRAEQPGLGIQFDAAAEGGLTVSRIDEDSIGAQAGLRAGDRIVSVDGQTIASHRQFQAYVSGQHGRRVPVVIERDGRQYTVQLGMRRPAADGAWLGVFLNDQEEGQVGARITQVYPAGPAARAGLRPGDIVLQINGKEMAGTPELIATVESFQPRERVEFLVRRGQTDVTLPVMLGSRDSFVFYSDDEYGGEEFDAGQEDEFSRIPPYAMQLEHDRRMAEQHQRIEMELRKLQEEVRKLREALQPRN